MKQRIALIGWGAIGQGVVRVLDALRRPDVEVVAILVRDASTAAQAFPDRAPLFVTSLAALLDTHPTLVCECAGHGAVDAYAEAALLAGVDVLLVSVGALSDAARAQRLEAAAVQGNCQLSLASGAIGGLDWLVSARTAGLSSVVYRGRKPPLAWSGTVAESLLNLKALKTAEVFFRGTAREAASRFPKNANVAATVGLASLGMDATRVELIADPAVTDNVHEVEAISEAGTLHIRLSGKPDPLNPKTSMITAHSAVRVILRRCDAMIV